MPKAGRYADEDVKKSAPSALGAHASFVGG